MRSRLLAHGDFLNLSRFSPSSVTPDTFTLDNGVIVSVIAPGIITFSPAKRCPEGKYIVLSSGVHGNETAPIELCDDFVKRLLLQQMIPRHDILFLFGNLEAMAIAERFVEENMNRLFSGAHSAGEGLINTERQRAKQLEHEVTAFFDGVEGRHRKIHYDLHTAIRESKNEKFAVYPFLHGKPYSRSQLAFMKACGVKTILLSESSTTTFSYYSSRQHDAHAFTVELGKVKPFGQNDMSRFDEARNALYALICNEELAVDEDISDMVIYRVNQVINRTEETFTLHFDDATPNFTDFKQGELLASEPGARYVAGQDGEAIVFPNANVAIGQRALLTVVPTTLENVDV